MERSIKPLFFILAFTIIGCQSSNQVMTEAQKAEIEETINNRMSVLISAVSKVDTTVMLSFYHEVEDVILEISNSVVYSYDQLATDFRGVVNKLESQEVVSIYTKVFVYSPQMVITTSYGKAKILYKNGDNHYLDFGWTIVWKKINGDWKVVHLHQSLKPNKESASDE